MTAIDFSSLSKEKLGDIRKNYDFYKEEEEIFMDVASAEEIEEVRKYEEWLNTNKEEEGPEIQISVLEVLQNHPDTDKVLSLVGGIYLAFPGFEVRDDLPAVFPYDVMSEWEAAAAAAYFQYIKDLHGTSHKNYLQVSEALEAFNTNNYKEDDMPIGFEAMSNFGTMLLSRVMWTEALWIIPALQKQGKRILEEMKVL